MCNHELTIKVSETELQCLVCKEKLDEVKYLQVQAVRLKNDNDAYFERLAGRQFKATK
jgi:hypothetical protein